MTNKKTVLVFLIVMVSFLFMPINTEAAENVESVPLDNIFKVPQGANSYVDGNNVIITDQKTAQIGSVFSSETNKMDLSKNFTAEMYINIDGFGDGVAFVMHNDPDKTSKFSGLTGQGLSIYASNYQYVNNNLVLGPSQLKKSFAIEFDTYHNGDGYDRAIDGNSGRGHIAYTFPDS